MKANLLLFVETAASGNPLAGEPTDEWTRVRQAWFESLEMTAREYQNAQQMKATVTHKLKCAYFPGANRSMRLTAGNDPTSPARVFNVASVVNEKEQNRFLIWMAEEVV